MKMTIKTKSALFSLENIQYMIGSGKCDEGLVNVDLQS